MKAGQDDRHHPDRWHREERVPHGRSANITSSSPSPRIRWRGSSRTRSSRRRFSTCRKAIPIARVPACISHPVAGVRSAARRGRAQPQGARLQGHHLHRRQRRESGRHARRRRRAEQGVGGHGLSRVRAHRLLRAGPRRLPRLDARRRTASTMRRSAATPASATRRSSSTCGRRACGRIRSNPGAARATPACQVIRRRPPPRSARPASTSRSPPRSGSTTR